ncbi:MAG TPA: hypothetical protein VEB23_06015 [Ramlibacter sp.]|nr:hypothetical protein [Ramlibacter sp.]
MSTSPRILLADTPEGVEAFREALVTSFAIVPVTTFERARSALDSVPALVVCGCHFDEGRMYDLLRYMKATPALERVPFLAVRAMRGELEDTLYESVKIAVRALGGNAFVDLLRWQRRWGVAEASHRLTHLVQTLVSATPDTA